MSVSPFDVAPVVSKNDASALQNGSDISDVNIGYKSENKMARKRKLLLSLATIPQLIRPRHHRQNNLWFHGNGANRQLITTRPPLWRHLLGGVVFAQHFKHSPTGSPGFGAFCRSGEQFMPGASDEMLDLHQGQAWTISRLGG